MACNVVDRAMQAFGAEGLSQDQPLASSFANLRTLRFADVCLHQTPLVLTSLTSSRVLMQSTSNKLAKENFGVPPG